MRRLGSWVLAAALAAGGAHAVIPSVPPPASPALSQPGALPVGRTTITVPADAGQRALRILVWYPATRQQGRVAAPYRWHAVAPPPMGALDVTFPAIAVEGAPKAAGRHPLVIVSHGFGGAPEHMTWIAENLASKGYVVAGIDHADPAFTDPASFQRSFGQAVAFRARDQQRAIAALAATRSALAGSVDPDRVAVIGYSMGGFGALATAGMGYDPASTALKSLPPGTLAGQLEGRHADPHLKAVVAIAPWGAQAPHRVWSQRGPAALRLPLLMIAGDADDVSGYADGILPLFERATGSDRWLLTFHHARHNVGGNPLPPEAAGSAGYREFFEQPVWRTERLNAINTHFITAFLDLHLKGETACAAMLAAPAAGGAWPGFPARSALGFELVHRTPQK